MKKFKTPIILSMILIVALCLGLILPSLLNPDTQTEGTIQNNDDTTNTTDTSDTAATTIQFDEEDWVSDYDESLATQIVLNNDSTTINGEGASFLNQVVTISSAGTYVISGTLENGQLIVNTSGTVRLIFNGLTISSNTLAPVEIKSADKTIITLVAGTSNTLSDVASTSDTRANATLHSKDDLVINGEGTLIVNAKYNNGIQSNDTLKLISGNIEVTSLNHALKGKDAILVAGGTYTLVSQGDGLQSDNEEDASLGIITIDGGTFNITTANDGIQAQTALQINGGSFTIKTGNGASSSPSDDISTKGLKAGSSLVVTGGTFNINTTDDSLHSNGTLSISGGQLTLASGDDGIHADRAVLISAGTIDITQSYEGIEGENITISGGTIKVKASDDGLNAASDSGSDLFLKITGGDLYVNADGDGLDSNGDLIITGGVTIVEGPTSDGDGALDADGEITISGGTLLAIGSSGMAEYPSTASEQYSFALGVNQSSNSKIIISDASGNIIYEFTATKSFSSIVFSSPDLVAQATYTVSVDGSESSITLQDITTVSNLNSMGGGQGGNFGNPGEQGGRRP